MEPTFTRLEIEDYLKLIDYSDELVELAELFLKQLKRYPLVDARAITALLMKKKTTLLF